MFIAPTVTAETEYVFSLVVFDGALYSEADEVIITVVMTDNDDNNIINNNITLGGNYPNPFNPETEIVFSMQNQAQVRLVVYNIKGEVVKELVNSNLSAGEHRILWRGTDAGGNTVGNGIYYYKMQSGKYTSSGKMVLLK
jgi:flagellar hook assembly protein FlgD